MRCALAGAAMDATGLDRQVWKFPLRFSSEPVQASSALPEPPRGSRTDRFSGQPTSQRSTRTLSERRLREFLALQGEGQC